MNQMIKAAAAASLLAIPAFAFSGVSENAWMEGARFEADLAKIKEKTFRILPEESSTWRPGDAPAIPNTPVQDAFAGVDLCERLDSIRFIRAPGLDEAVGLVAPCLQALSKGYAVPVTARRGIISAGWTMGGPEGILIEVGQPIPLGNTVIRDLKRALELRKNVLLGHPAKVEVHSPEMPRVQLESSLQAAVDACVLAAIHRPVADAGQFVAVYGPCLKSSRELAITEFLPVQEGSRTVLVMTRVDRRTLKAMNGYVRVPGERGPVTLTIQAYPAVTIQPFGL